VDRFANSALTAFSAITAGVAYIVGVIRLGEQLWAAVVAAEKARWYGAQDIPVVREVLALLFAVVIFAGGVYVFLVLPVLVVRFVYDGVRRGRIGGLSSGPDDQE